MRLTGRIVAGMLLCALFISMAACSTAKKPAPEDIPSPTPAYLFPAASDEVSMLSNRLARVAESVPGVRGAVVVLSRTTAIVGLDLYPGTSKDELFLSVARKLQDEDARIHTVRISSSSAMYDRIEKVSRGIHDGHSVNTYAKEIVEIMRQTPPVKL